MDNTPKNKQELNDELARAFAGFPADDAREIDDEMIALLAEGRIGELPADQRSTLLRAVARDPQAGAILAELSELGLGERENNRSVSPSDSDDKEPGVSPGVIQFSRLTRGLFGAWALAACLLAGIALWPAAAPPTTSQIGHAPGGQVDLYGTEGSDSGYWDQLDRQRQGQSNDHLLLESSRLRDYALIGSIATCMLLSTALVMSVCRDNHHRRRHT